jgi:hypothetical protein
MALPQPQQRRLQLLDLPNEIISHIFQCLDSPSRFLQASFKQPDGTAARASSAPLKEASRLCRRLRKLALPYLFANLIINPAHLRPLISFLQRHDLAVHVRTIVAQIPSPCSHYHPPWWKQIPAHATKLRTLSIIAPPHLFSEVMGTDLHSQDNWAFNMPYQILQLECDPSGLSPNDSGANNVSADSHILTARPWTSILVNEGSSLKVYTTWEYWLRSTPSPLNAVIASPHSAELLHNLRHFSIVSIFPVYTHFAKTVDFIRRLYRLQSLFVKLVPEPESTVLSDEIEEAKGHMDVNDPWGELSSNFDHLATACLYLSERNEDEVNEAGLARLGELRELRIDDVKVVGIRDTTVSLFMGAFESRPDLHWGYVGDGVWRRNLMPQS